MSACFFNDAHYTGGAFIWAKTKPMGCLILGGGLKLGGAYIWERDYYGRMKC